MAGAGEWLAGHPERDVIIHRYLRHQPRLAAEATARLLDEDSGGEAAEADEAAGEPAAGEARAPAGEAVEGAAGGAAASSAGRPLTGEHARLRDLRLTAVLAALKTSGARRVLDLGCGDGRLLAGMLQEAASSRRSSAWTHPRRALERAARRLRLDEMAPRQRARIQLLQGALTYRDRRLAGYDAAALIEVIEHIDPDRLGALEQAVFGGAAPAAVVVTTPNAEYNVRYPRPGAGRAAAPGPPVRMDPGRVRGWADGGGRPARLHGRFEPRRGGRRRASARRRSWPCSGTMPVTTIKIPELCLVVLVGATGSGKSTFAARHFRPTEVVSSDFCRGLVGRRRERPVGHRGGVRGAARRSPRSGWPRAAHRGRRHQRAARGPRAAAGRLARDHHVLPVAIVLDVPRGDLQRAQQGARPDRDFGPHVIARPAPDAAPLGARQLQREGFRHVFMLRGAAEVDAAHDRARAALDRPADRTRAVRHHRRRARLPRRARGRCSALGYWPACETRPARRARIRPGAPRCSSATWSTAARTRRGCCAW